ncbi:MAG: helix-turn-helix domain-containing protein [Bacteroidota bacterium]|uniref:helix-turn-helix domain-containing protein n=1 Tax=Mucilaginibacter inviolabilis TaxID=2714892 RepID=UPI00140E07DA|nr:helix-turn-helix domain-containing protein [Mucilaginibacter inviolabilis]NHA05879.1 helix-turn-helix domain-containing protein [Mucilaginibacter inviolabilis]
MTPLDLITKQDLEQFKTELFAELRALGISASTEKPAKQWLRSIEVRKLLKIAPGTLQNLRINGTLTYTQIGNIHYYRYDDIVKILEKNIHKN